ncbi:hypothetical protein K2173_004534 [Erythroxylum novogranatense]|uniref:Fatty acid hydroxylase domain-containing protein n=1 Tax=Erythroxylum novogranatense TaxID=1862640 RepID=A0AAV8T4M8_9ROSI|nr:hypothetical protein K2173_004534 [Erythroxylum novogranatense]
MLGDMYLQKFVDETTLYNDITWLRNYLAATLIYFVSGFLWCFYIYYWKRNVYVHTDNIPTTKAMLLQIYVAMKAMPFYCALPTLSEFMIENGWTKCFSTISEVGWFTYILYSVSYFVLVEFAIYWMHKGMHDIKPLYKYLHATHHTYNNRIPVSFSLVSLAFHPIDGLLEAAPHVMVLFFIPTHFRTHIGLIFLEAIWTANTHDCIHAKIWPIMGAGYHTIHHTTYRHNYGHYTKWMDWMLGTLRHPDEDANDKLK